MIDIFYQAALVGLIAAFGSLTISAVAFILFCIGSIIAITVYHYQGDYAALLFVMVVLVVLGVVNAQI